MDVESHVFGVSISSVYLPGELSIIMSWVTVLACWAISVPRIDIFNPWELSWRCSEQPCIRWDIEITGKNLLLIVLNN